MHRPGSLVAEELTACIRCNLCLAVCPALGTPITIETLNRETLDGPISPQVMRFAQNCCQCGACVPVCPVGLHRDSMMMWLKMRLLRGYSPEEPIYGNQDEEEEYIEARAPDASRAWAARGWDDD
jgi:Na+-translocating ferredoxin:NAD+ oxidoreductase RnfC subunit